MPHVVSESPHRVWESEIRASGAGPAIYVRYKNFIFVLVSMSSFSGDFVSWKFRIFDFHDFSQISAERWYVRRFSTLVHSCFVKFVDGWRRVIFGSIICISS